jgi:hypothetical protein
MKVERTVQLDPDAAELLIQLAGSPRKQGEYLSALIREKAREQNILAARITALEEELARLKADVVTTHASGRHGVAVLATEEHPHG